MKEHSFLICLIFAFIFYLSTRRFRKEFTATESVYKVICTLEKEGRPGAKLSKYLLFCTIISFAAAMAVITFY